MLPIQRTAFQVRRVSSPPGGNPHLGNVGVDKSYVRLAKSLNAFLPTGLPNELSETENEELKDLEVIEKIGGGGATRTPDLGIMRPSL